MDHLHQPITEYIDLDDLEYDKDTLRFLRKKLDDFTIDVFRQIVQQNKQSKGLIKTRLDNYHSARKRYDAAFLVLESQGFIEKQEDGTTTPYYVTVRGRQLGTLLNHERMSKEELKRD